MRIPELLVICDQMQKAVDRQAEVIRGNADLRPGPRASLVKTECTLELFKIGKGSAQLFLAPPEPEPVYAAQQPLDLDTQTLGEAAARAVVSGLRAAVKEGPSAMPFGVRRAFEDMGQLLTNGVSSIQLIAPGQKANTELGTKAIPRLSVKFDQTLWKRIDQRRETSTKTITLDGTLEMADFKFEDYKCIIRTHWNQRILCSFEPEMADQVQNALRHVTRIVGTATVNTKTGKTEHIHLETLQVVNPLLGPEGDFFAPRTLQQLTEQQGTDPGFDLRTVENLWPEDSDVEVFLAAIERANS